MLRRVEALVFVALCFCATGAVADPNCEDGEVYEAGIPFETCYYIEETGSCPQSGYGGTWVQLFEPPSIPWEYTGVCVIVSSFGSALPFAQPATVVAYGLAEGNSSTSWAPVPIKSELLYESTLNLTVYDQNSPNTSFTNVPVSFVTYAKKLFIGVRFLNCGIKVCIPSYKNTGAKHLTYWSVVTSETFTRGGARSYAVRAEGQPYVPGSSETIPGWTCNRTRYLDGITCDCGCGLPDPDCFNSTIGPLSADCSADEVCSPQGECVEHGWNATLCNVQNFGTDKICDCGCGTVRDPDCDTAFNPVHCDGAVVTCNLLTNKCIDAWTCSNKTAYNDSSICNCGCGITDPDCLNPELPSDCQSGFACKSNLCVPELWNCTAGYYNSDDGCDCVCGAYDPDCLINEQIYRCLANESCNFDAECIPAFCGNSFVDLRLGEECDGGVGCLKGSCKCDPAFAPSLPAKTLHCNPICGNGITSPGEECDGTPFCNNETCTCTEGHPANATTMLCTGCGNSAVDGGEECDGGEGCAEDCTCSKGFVQTDPPSVSCTKKSSQGGIIAAVVVSSLVAVVLVIGGVFFIVRQIKKRPSEMAPATQQVVMIPVGPDGVPQGPPVLLVGDHNGVGSSGSLATVPPTASTEGGYYVGSPMMQLPDHGSSMMVPPPPDSAPGAPSSSAGQGSAGSGAPAPPSGSGQEYLYDRWGNPVGILA